MSDEWALGGPPPQLPIGWEFPQIGEELSLQRLQSYRGGLSSTNTG